MTTKRLHLALALAVSTLLLAATQCSARRGALVRDGMSSKSAYDNPNLGKKGDLTTDPDVIAITTRCAKWSVDPIDARTIEGLDDDDVLPKEIRSMPLHVSFRSKTLGANGKRPNWMRATATLGDPSLKSKARPALPIRAVWTCSNADSADSGMTIEDPKTGSRKELGSNALEDSYEDCLKRLYGKYVELEVLLPRTKKGLLNRGGPPPSVVYRVPIRSGHVNPFGMVSKSRATATLYPNGRTLAASAAGGEGDATVPLGTTNVHLPLGPGLVDPGWAKGRRVFWKGRSLGLV